MPATMTPPVRKGPDTPERVKIGYDTPPAPTKSSSKAKVKTKSKGELGSSSNPIQKGILKPEPKPAPKAAPKAKPAPTKKKGELGSNSNPIYIGAAVPKSNQSNPQSAMIDEIGSRSTSPKSANYSEQMKKLNKVAPGKK